MANMQFANNAVTTLVSGITNVATSITVTSAVAFPTLTGAQYFYCTLIDAATGLVIEIVKVTAVVASVFTIVRAQDGTTASAYLTGDKVELRLTRASLNDFPKLDEDNIFTASLTVTGHTTFEGVTSTGATGTGKLVYDTSPTLVTPALGTPSALVGTNITGTATAFTASNVTTNANLTGPITSIGNATSIASQTGTGTKFVVDNTPTLITPVLGVATATSINKMAITAPATSSTLAVADGKTLTANRTITLNGTDGKTLSVNNSIALSGTDSTTMTFPTTSATIARTDAAQTFTGVQTFNGNIINGPATAPAFSAYVSATQSISTATNTKVQFTTKEFDTNSNYASNTFTPTVAGYYQVITQVYFSFTSGPVVVAIYKNGASIATNIFVSTAFGTFSLLTKLVYMNGSTDYLEVYATQYSGTAQNVGLNSYFQAAMVRSA